MLRKLESQYYSLVFNKNGDLPQNVIINHSLIQKHATVYYRGSPESINTYIIDTPYDPGDLTCFGTDLHKIISMLREIYHFESFIINNFAVDTIKNMYYSEFGKKIKPYNFDTYILKNQFKIKPKNAVILCKNHLDLINQASEYFDWYGFTSVIDMLKEGYIAGIFENNMLVSVAYTSSFTNKYVDIGIRTKKEYRGRGYATDAAAKVIETVLSLNKIPVWNVMEENYPSILVCNRLGFSQVKRSYCFC